MAWSPRRSAPSTEAAKRRAFVTSVAGNGNLFSGSWPGASGATSLDRADSVCRARATAGGLPNATTYRAWLSTPAVSAIDRVLGDGPWLNLMGEMALVTCSSRHPTTMTGMTIIRSQITKPILTILMTLLPFSLVKNPK